MSADYLGPGAVEVDPQRNTRSFDYAGEPLGSPAALRMTELEDLVMRITIDNFDGLGAVEYTAALDGTVAPVIERTINQPSTMRCSLLAGAGFVVPASGARVVMTRSDGTFLFTGYLTQAPTLEYQGQGERGWVVRYEMAAESDEVLLDERALPDRAPFVSRSAGSELRQLAQDLLPG